MLQMKKVYNKKGKRGEKMPKRRKDPSTVGLGSPDVQGQGTTERETGTVKIDSSRKKTKR
jgi:hypothetical protein